MRLNFLFRYNLRAYVLFHSLATGQEPGNRDRECEADRRCTGTPVLPVSPVADRRLYAGVAGYLGKVTGVRVPIKGKTELKKETSRCVTCSLFSSTVV
jgi:hypothetical protein